MYNYLYMTTIQKDSPPELPGFEQLSAFEKKYVENLAGNYQLTAKCESAPLDTFEKGVAPALYKPASMLLPGNEIFNRTANYLTHHDSYEDTFEIGVDLGIEINNSSRNDRDKFLLFISTVEAIALMRNALGILKNKTMSDVEDVIALTILESDKPLKDKIKLLEVIDEAIDDIREKVDVEDDDFTFVRAHHSIVRLRKTLHRAIALEQVNCLAGCVRENLHLDMAGTHDGLLKEHRRIAERTVCLTHGLDERSAKIFFLLDPAHPATAATGNGLGEDGKADGVGPIEQFVEVR